MSKPNPEHLLLITAKDFNVEQISNVVLGDKRFALWSGASKPYQHHYGKGGLAQHTLEVVDLCLKNNHYYEGTNKFIDPRKVFLAALFHDAGKMWDYEPTEDDIELYGQISDGKPALEWTYNNWQGTEHKRLIHHISRSGIVWHEAFVKFGNTLNISPNWNDEILHAILAHHGQRAWGSPVAPNTRLAWLLHLSDCISARMDDADKWDQVKTPTSK